MSGERVDPVWLAIYTTRTFDYQKPVERLTTVTEVSSYLLATENSPDTFCYDILEDIVAPVFLAIQFP
ncbi:hypothetical protein B9H04_06950 [Halorubrum ezzemoulense DSM 17463]|uniref:Uncharacterized protein n=1 Tax=Halorubrum ezzemoulense DSM 17463 TaxID=1121945 RepID=A0A1X4H915_HALEZ|nr:hypothetical protein B9H04_06950 [Halorubrum ezzemoulense DSM 17463]